VREIEWIVQVGCSGVDMTVELDTLLKTKKNSATFEGGGALLLLQTIAFGVWSNLDLNLICLFSRSLFTCRAFFFRSLLLRRIYSLLYLECYPISISNLNLNGLLSTGRDKERPMRLR